MIPLVSKIAIIANKNIDWLDKLKESYQLHFLPLLDYDFSFLDSQQYYLLLVDDEASGVDIETIIYEVSRTQELVSIVVLTRQNNPNYKLKLLKQGVLDVFNIFDDHDYLTSCFELVIQKNNVKRFNIQQNRSLNAISVISRHLHNAIDPETLINDMLDITSKLFNLQALVIILKSGKMFHIVAGILSPMAKQSILDIMINIPSEAPILQVIEENITMVFSDLSIIPPIVDIPIFTNSQSAILLPLHYTNIVLGAMIVVGHDDFPLTRDDVVVYEHLATHFGNAYQNVRQAQTQNVNAETNRHLLRTWQQLSQVYTLQGIDEIIRILASEIKHVKHSLVWIYSETSKQIVIDASNAESINIFQQLYSAGTIDAYLEKIDNQLRPLILWLGRSNQGNMGELFQAMSGQQLIFIPITDEARWLGGILVSSNSNEEMSNEYIGLLEGIAYAAGQTLARNMLINYKDEQAIRLETITHGIKDGIFFVTDSEFVVFCNPQFTELTGINPLKILNQNVQNLIEELISICDNPKQTQQNLQEAIEKIKGDSIDQEYPIVEVNISSISSQLYIEFNRLSKDNKNSQGNWIGILHHNHETFTETGLISVKTSTTLDVIQNSALDIYNDLVSFDYTNLTSKQFETIAQLKEQASQIDKLLNCMNSLDNLQQQDILTLTKNNPNDILSHMWNHPALLHYEDQLDIKTLPKDIIIRVDQHHMSLALINLIEVALYLSVDDTQVQVRLEYEASMFIFQVLVYTTVSPQLIDQILNMPESHIKSLPYAHQMCLYFSKVLINQHDGNLTVKESSTSDSIQFHVTLPTFEEVTDKESPTEALTSIPKRKSFNIMVYDQNIYANDVNYESIETQDYSLIYCDTLEQVYNEIDMIRVDLIILTIRKLDNVVLKYIKRLREQKRTKIPILVLSVYNTEEIRVSALQAGVDAYSGLPISNAELLAQAKALFERSKLPARVHKPLIVGQLYIDFAQRKVALDGKNVKLTRIEYDLLHHLALNIGQVVTYAELLSEIWGPQYRNEKQHLWVTMSRLRKKLKSSQDGQVYIMTQSGVGYILKKPDIIGDDT